MISVPKNSEESVLDLCVRKSVKRCVSPREGFTFYSPEREISNSSGCLDLCSRDRGDLRVFRPIIAQDMGYSATVAVLQQRLYGDKLRSPPLGSLGSDHGDSLSVRSDSPTSPPYIGIAAQVTGNTNRAGKPTRPFKAYPKDPLTLVSSANEGVPGESNEAYAEFRRRMLEQVHAATGGNSGNKNMKRPVQSISPTNQQPSSSMDPKDSAYWERRRKNNEAAKRSRDARRAKEDEIAIRAAFLEQENVKLKYEVAGLRDENNRLREKEWPGRAPKMTVKNMDERSGKNRRP